MEAFFPLHGWIDVAEIKWAYLILRDLLVVVEKCSMDMSVSAEAITVFRKSDRFACGGQCVVRLPASFLFGIETMVFKELRLFPCEEPNVVYGYVHEVPIDWLEGISHFLSFIECLNNLLLLQIDMDLHLVECKHFESLAGCFCCLFGVIVD